jgi:hypothetical protein
VYPHETCPKEAKAMYSKEQINELINQIQEELTNQHTWITNVAAGNIVGKYILE